MPACLIVAGFLRTGPGRLPRLRGRQSRWTRTANGLLPDTAHKIIDRLPHKPILTRENSGAVVPELIASPYMDCFLLVRPGYGNGARIPERRYEQLTQAAADQGPPRWLLDTVRQAWPDLRITGQPLGQSVPIRPRTELG